jgi:hypothetical protein
MNQSLFPENELFSFTKPSMVLYVEDVYNTEINTFIQSNLKQIVEYYSAKEIDFCYLPYLLQNADYQAVVNYNRPYLQPDLYNDSVAEVYSKVKQLLVQPFQGSGLVLLESDNSSSTPAIGFQLIEDNSLFDQFNLAATAIYELNDEKELRESDNQPSYKRTLREPKANYKFEDELVEEESKPYDNGIRFHVVRENDADAEFDEQAYKLADEIREKIRQLKESGSLTLIGDILDEIQGAAKKLSTVFITNDYRIFLKDYDMKEVVMSPLPKSVFILFLRHPEGILFKQLSNYHDELLSIYRNITVHENMDRVIESIRALTDPLNDSINEKCSRIRAAFLEVIAENLAQNYYVTGKRGEPKKIILDRSLVEFQK